MKIDNRHTPAEVRQFASQLKTQSPGTVAELAGLFHDDQSDEFYMGLLSGLSSALALLQQGAADYLPLIVAAAAEKVEKREIT